MAVKKKKHKKSVLREVVPERNGAFFDTWSIVHFCTGVAMGWLIDPAIALALMILWEPFEIFILSPILGQFGIIFGFESLKNSLSDIFFDTLGIALGAIVIAELITPPFVLFQ